MPFLALFLSGFGYVGVSSMWHGAVGRALRDLFASPDRVVVPPRAVSITRATMDVFDVEELAPAPPPIPADAVQRQRISA